MAILSRVKISPQQRYDLEDFFAEQAAARTDSKLFVQKFLSDANLILAGFSVTGIGLKAATVLMSNCALIIPQNSFDFSYFISAPAEPDIVISDAELVDNARNYVELQLSTKDNTLLTKAFWDAEANSGKGAEFNQIVNTITDLQASFVTSTGGFSGSPDRIPIAIIDTDSSGTIKIILDRRQLFGRLATVGNVDNNFSWGTKVEPIFQLNMSGVSGTFLAGETITIGSETATVYTGGTSSITFNVPSGVNYSFGQTVTGGTSGATGSINTVLESFIGVDKNLKNQKNINDALMTEIKSIKGTRFWWQDALVSLDGLSSFVNSIIAPFSSGAKVSWNGSVLSITDSSGSPADADVVAKVRLFGHAQQLNLTRQDGTGGSTTLAIADGQVLFVQLPTSGDRTYSGAGSGATNYQVVARNSFSLSDPNYWIAYREGSKIFFRGTGELQSGESSEIGDNVPQTLLDNLGLSNEVAPASYSSDIRGVAAQSLVGRIGVLTDAVGDEQEDRSGYFRSDDPITWSGVALSFTADIVLEFVNTKSGVLSKHTISSSQSPIALNNLESAYLLIDRSQTNEACTFILSDSVAIPPQSQSEKDVFVLCRRQDASAGNFLHIPFHKQLIEAGQTTRFGSSGSGGGGGGGTPPLFIQEVPSGTVNGINDTFVLGHTPKSNSAVLVTVNSIKTLVANYTITGASIQFHAGSIPQLGQKVECFYIATTANTIDGAQEVPTGTINGINAAFTIVGTPTAATLLVFVDGVREKIAAWSLTGPSTITFNAGFIPQVGQSLEVYYAVSIDTTSVYQEIPSGTINGINDTFALAHTPPYASGAVVFVDGLKRAPTEWTLVVSLGVSSIKFNAGSIPQLGQSLEVYYFDVPGGGGGGSTQKVEYRVITGGEATAKQLTLASTPTTANQTVLDVIGVGPQFYGDDFTVSGNVLSWSGLGLDSLPVSSGDKFRIIYPT